MYQRYKKYNTSLIIVTLSIAITKSFWQLSIIIKPDPIKKSVGIGLSRTSTTNFNQF